MFVQLFETHPDVQDNFADFRGQTIESLKGSIGKWRKTFCGFQFQMRPRISKSGRVRRMVRNPLLKKIGFPSLLPSSRQSNIDIAECAWCAGCA